MNNYEKRYLKNIGLEEHVLPLFLGSIFDLISCDTIFGIIYLENLNGVCNFVICLQRFPPRNAQGSNL